MNRVVKKRGFTIVELMLAMGFVSALLLAIAMTIIQIGNTYTRSVTYKNVNQAGSAIASELQRSFAETTAFVINGGAYYDNQINEGGRLCIGKYSYVWNYGKDIYNGKPNYVQYSGALDSQKNIYFVKVRDPNASYCTKISGKYTDIKKSDAMELLDNGQYDLAIHSFTITSYSSANDSVIGQRLYNINFVIGTNDQLAFDTSITTPTCSLSGPSANPFYCAVNQFNIIARSGSKD
jgi:type II secretory pathway pseudopilin PulG